MDLYIPRIRKQLPGDPFFSEGDAQRFVQYMRCDSNFSNDFSIDKESFICKEPNCGQLFTSLIKYEAHTFNCHMHKCSVCGKSFPSNRILSIHIAELHDLYFLAMAERKPSYCCLVDGCEVMCGTNEDRRNHLVRDHFFPKTYDFHNPSKYRRRYLQKSHRKSSIPQDAIVPSKKATATSKHVNRKSDDTSMDIDQDVALLTAEFSRSLHCIPKNISFGRRSQGSFSKSFNTSK